MLWVIPPCTLLAWPTESAPLESEVASRPLAELLPPVPPTVFSLGWWWFGSRAQMFSASARTRRVAGSEKCGFAVAERRQSESSRSRRWRASWLGTCLSVSRC